MVRSRVVACVLLSAGLGVGLPQAVQARQGSPSPASSRLAEIKGLYEAADYDGALAVVDAAAAAAPVVEAREIGIYETLCLLALGKTAQASEKVEGFLRAEPLYQPSSDLPRRLLVLVESTRNRLRPSLALSHYAAGKALFEAQKYDAAVKAFDVVLELTTPTAEGAKDLSDTRILASGFRDLAARAVTPLKPAVAVAETPPAPGPPPANPVASPGLVVPPVVIRQALPRWPTSQNAPKAASSAEPRLGVLEVVITKTGTVESVQLIKRIDPLYDVLLLDAAKRWRYQPATKDGMPVEYVKRVEVNIR